MLLSPAARGCLASHALSRQRRPGIVPGQAIPVCHLEAGRPCSSSSSNTSRGLSVAPATSSQATSSNESSSSTTSTSSSAGVLERDAKLLRRALGASSAAEVVDILVQQHDSMLQGISPADAELLLTSSLEQGNAELALSIYKEMCTAKRASSTGISAACPWPPAALETTTAVVLGLCKQIRVGDALAIMEGICSQGVPKAEEVSFGKVINSPIPPKGPLAVVQPQEGSKLVADSNSRYEFELFSGTVVSCKSEALAPASNPLLSAARAVGLWKRPPVAAVHEFVLQAPDGTSRTFRAGTETAEVPGQVGERLTVVCAPSRGSKTKMRRLLLSTRAPGTKPGQPMAATNHRTGAQLLLLQPPVSGTQAALPGWVLPVAVLLAGGDAASGLLDPALPLAIATGVAVLGGSTVAGNSLLLPRLKQLPPNAVKVESMRQELLAKHSGLTNKVEATLQEATEDVRTLARLWQLQVKMQSVGGNSSGAYGARIERVTAARGSLEERLAKRLELLDGYARVMNMIEIEVEMEMQVPDAELAGIEEQLVRLEELEELKGEWQVQAEAQDEVEKLLRTTSLPLLP